MFYRSLEIQDFFKKECVGILPDVVVLHGVGSERFEKADPEAAVLQSFRYGPGNDTVAGLITCGTDEQKGHECQPPGNPRPSHRAPFRKFTDGHNL
jgi:hypothetical protein